MFTKIRWVFFGLLLVCLSAGAFAQQLGNYDFDDTLTNSSGPAPSLVDLGSNSFTTEDVFGFDCKVLDFDEGTGLSLDISGLPAISTYTFIGVMNLSETYYYNRIMDVSDLQEDYGLYAYEDDLIYYNYDDPDFDNFDYDEWTIVVFSRDASGLLEGYVDGVQVFSLFDSDDNADIDVDTLYFFVDDSSEHYDGQVANIQLYNTAIDPGSVANLEFSCSGVTGFVAKTPSPPVPSNNPLALLWLALVLGLSGAIFQRRRSTKQV